MRKTFLIALIGVIALTVRVPVRAQTPNTVHIAMRDFAVLDPVALPHITDGLADSARDVVENLFVGLMRYNPLTARIEPMLAQSSEVAADGLTWTFHLRKDVQWIKASGGTVTVVRPVVAGDFVYAFRRACDPQPPRPAANNVFIVAGCSAIATADPKIVTDLFIAQTLGAQAVDPQTLTITLAFPAVYFPALLTLPEFRPVPRESITKNADWTQPDAILTNGPWALKDWTRGASLNLMRNPAWPDAPVGNLTDVAISLTLGAPADFTRLDPGLPAAPPAGFVVQRTPAASVVLGFSGENTLIKNAVVRRALAFAIDRNALVKALPDDSAITASRFTPTGTADNSGFAPDAAKSTLAASPIPACNRLPDKLTLAVEDSPSGAAAAQVLVSGWNAILGCNPTSFSILKLPADALQRIAHAEVNTDLSSNGTPRPLLWIASWRAEYPDLNAWTGDGLHCQFGFMRTYAACGDAEVQIELAGHEADPAKRAAEYAQAETDWFGSAGSFPVAPLYTMLAARTHQSWLTNIADGGALRFDQWRAATHG